MYLYNEQLTVRPNFCSNYRSTFLVLNLITFILQVTKVGPFSVWKNIIVGYYVVGYIVSDGINCGQLKLYNRIYCVKLNSDISYLSTFNVAILNGSLFMPVLISLGNSYLFQDRYILLKSCCYSNIFLPQSLFH